MSTASTPDRDWAAQVGESETVRAVFEDMPMMMLATAGPEHRIVAANAAYRAVARRDVLVGRTIAEAFPEVRGQQIYEMYDRVYRTGEPQVAREWRIQADVEGNGTLSDIYFDFTVTPRRAADETVAGLTLIAVDVSEKVRARQRAERRYEHARHTIAMLQRELLPSGLPLLPRLRLAAAYLAAEADTAAGGDWFDAMALGGGRAAFAVGDVVGHGVAASAAMGQMRAVVQDRLLDTGDIVAALSALERLAERLPAVRSATVCVAVFDPAGGEVRYCTAGHPPPLLIGAGGSGRYLPSTGAGPIGGGGAFPVAGATLAEGDLLVLVSDGLIERPGRDHAGSLVEIAQVAGDAAADRALRDSGLSAVQRVCTQTLEMLVRASGHADDVTILAAQCVAAPAPLRLDLRAELGVIATAHRSVAQWLRAAGVGEADVSALRHAVGELVTNCVEHAYRDAAGGPVRLGADLAADGTVLIEVRDEGRWLEREHTAVRNGGGLGLVLAGKVVDALRLRPGDRGTTAEIKHAVRTPPVTLADITTVSRPEADPALLLVLEQPRGVRVDGPITADTAAQLGRDLHRLSVNGTRALTVDLTGVTLLSSAGVAALLEVRRMARAHGTDLTVRAEPGSPAHHVLTLTALAPDPGPDTATA